jgi:uncharacterized membrane protein
MNYFQNRVHLKISAKDKLIGKYKAAVSVMLFTQLLQIIASEILARVSIFSTFGLVFNIVLTFCMLVIIGIIELGLCLFFLNIACDQPFSTNQLFHGFTLQNNHVLYLSALFALLQLICMKPGQILFQLFMLTFDTRYMVPTIMLLLAGILIYTPLSLMLSQSFYLILDFPDASAREIIKYSMKIMKGHKKQLFALQLSFLPLMLLCTITTHIGMLNVGMLWLLPYMTMANTLFYLDLMHPSAATSDSH